MNITDKGYGNRSMKLFDQYILDAYEVVDPMIEIGQVFRMHRYLCGCHSSVSQ